MYRIGLLALGAALGCSDPEPQQAGPGDATVVYPDLAVLPPGAGGAGGGGGGGGAPLVPNCAPQAEACDALDNDCDGLVDEIACSCAGPTACFAGPAAARGLGVCVDGERACDSSGEFFGPCLGSVGPRAETCNEADDDCDGIVDEQCDQPGAGGAGGGGGEAGAGGAGGDGPGQDREEVFVVGEDRAARPVDFVMAVDNSGSMDDTVAQVESNLGIFATRLVDAGVDYRVALVSQRGTRRNDPDVCIPPPMAGPDCADTAQFIHLDEEVDSEEPFEDLVKCWQRCDGGRTYRDFLRPDSLLQFVVVTDDESDMDWPDFQAFFASQGRDEFIVHGIVGLQDRGCVADRGDQYIAAANATGGQLLHICDNNWGQVIDVLLDATVIQLQREFPLAGRPDPATLRVFLVQPNGAEEEQIGNWDYDVATNAIVFREGFGPPAGARVIIRYTPR